MSWGARVVTLYTRTLHVWIGWRRQRRPTLVDNIVYNFPLQKMVSMASRKARDIYSYLVKAHRRGFPDRVSIQIVKQHVGGSLGLPVTDVH